MQRLFSPPVLTPWRCWGQAAVRFLSLARRVRLSSSAESEIVLMISNSRLQAWLNPSAISCIGSDFSSSSYLRLILVCSSSTHQFQYSFWCGVRSSISKESWASSRGVTNSADFSSFWIVSGLRNSLGSFIPSPKRLRQLGSTPYGEACTIGIIGKSSHFLRTSDHRASAAAC